MGQKRQETLSLNTFALDIVFLMFLKNLAVFLAYYDPFPQVVIEKRSCYLSSHRPILWSILRPMGVSDCELKYIFDVCTCNINLKEMNRYYLSKKILKANLYSCISTSDLTRLCHV